MLNEFVAQNRVSVRNGVQSSIRRVLHDVCPPPSPLLSVGFHPLPRYSYALYSSDSFPPRALSRVRKFVYSHINVYTSKEYTRFWYVCVYVCAGL